MTKTHGDLRAFYNTKLAPTLGKFQKERANIKRRVLHNSLRKSPRTFVFAFFAGVVFIYGLEIWRAIFDVGYMKENLPLPGVAIFAAVLAAYMVFNNAISSYFEERKSLTVRIKDFLIKKVLKLVAPEMIYHQWQHVPIEQFEKSGIYPVPVHLYGGGDCFSGKYEGVDLIFSKLHAYPTAKTGRGPSRKSSFEGIFFVADFHKDFRSSTFVIPTSDELVFGKRIGRLMKKLTSFQWGSLTRMECLEFEKMFAVYTEDAVEARYILSPKIMERMVAIQRRFPGNVAFAFHDSEIYITIPLKTDFIKPLCNLDLACVTAFYQQLRLFFDLVHDLNLTSRIWTKV